VGRFHVLETPLALDRYKQASPDAVFWRARMLLDGNEAR